MKKLTTYISHVKDFHSLNEYLNEKLIINKNFKNAYTYAPKSFKELRQIIEDKYNELGPGTKQTPINFNDIDVSNIDSFCNERNDIGLFERTKFEYINVSGWDVSRIKSMGFMFYECKQLKSVGDLSDWDVSNVEHMHYMFYNCENLKSIGDLSDWNVSSGVKTGYMFFCSAITNIPNWV